MWIRCVAPSCCGLAIPQPSWATCRHAVCSSRRTQLLYVVIGGPKDNHGSRPSTIGVTRDNGCFAPFHYVLGRFKRSVNPAFPRIFLPQSRIWQFEVEWFPIGIEDEIDTQAISG